MVLRETDAPAAEAVLAAAPAEGDH
jgi:hypothetical protein